MTWLFNGPSKVRNALSQNQWPYPLPSERYVIIEWSLRGGGTFSGREDYKISVTWLHKSQSFSHLVMFHTILLGFRIRWIFVLVSYRIQTLCLNNLYELFDAFSKGGGGVFSNERKLYRQILYPKASKKPLHTSNKPANKP